MQRVGRGGVPVAATIKTDSSVSMTIPDDAGVVQPHPSATAPEPHRAQDSRLMWALGNYSRFVRPGAVRYDISSKEKEDPYGVMVSAYKNQDGTWVVATWQPYRTSDAEGETLKPLAPCDGTATLAPRSITTFVSSNP